MTETCRRCGEQFENDYDTEQLVCDRCLYLDWHESDDDLEEGEELADF